VKSGCVKMALSAFEMTSLLFAFTSGQRLVRVPTREETQDRSDISLAVRQEKGEAVMRNQGVLRAKAFCSQTADESWRLGIHPAPRVQTGAIPPFASDSPRISSIEPTCEGTALSRDRAPAFLGRFYLAAPCRD
jgi:hypothetical protein